MMLNLFEKRSQNSMSDVDSFVKSWRLTKKWEDFAGGYFKKSLSGRINHAGDDHCDYAFPFTRFHPLFRSSIEPIVRPLVETLVAQDFITYTSCQGHIVEEELLELHVGLIVIEASKLTRIVAAVENANSGWDGNAAASFQVYHGELFCEKQHSTYLTCDIYLESNNMPFTTYMGHRQRLVSKLIRALSR